MKVADAMSHGVITITPDCLMTKAAEMMLKFDISGLPVLSRGKLVGIITQSDFLRRSELGTEPGRARWIKLLTEIGPAADQYTRSHGRQVGDVMTREVVTVTENTSLEEVVRLMERHHIKRVPVLRDDALVGMVTRSNLLHAFIVLAPKTCPATVSDAAIRQQVNAEFEKQAWMARSTVDVRVSEGVVELRGAVLDQRQRTALRVAVENVVGVKQGRDCLALSQAPTAQSTAQEQPDSWFASKSIG